MTDSQLIAMGWLYERSSGKRALAVRHCFNTALKKLTDADARQTYIYLFNQGRHEARGSK